MNKDVNYFILNHSTTIWQSGILHPSLHIHAHLAKDLNFKNGKNKMPLVNFNVTNPSSLIVLCYRLKTILTLSF